MVVHSRVSFPCPSRRGVGESAVRKWGSTPGAAHVRALVRWPGDVGRRPRGAGLGGVGGWGLGLRAACGAKQQQQAAGCPVLPSLFSFSHPPRVIRKEIVTPRVRELLLAYSKVFVQTGKPVL